MSRCRWRRLRQDRPSQHKIGCAYGVRWAKMSSAVLPLALKSTFSTGYWEPFPKFQNVLLSVVLSPSRSSASIKQAVLASCACRLCLPRRGLLYHPFRGVGLRCRLRLCLRLCLTSTFSTGYWELVPKFQNVLLSVEPSPSRSSQPT